MCGSVPFVKSFCVILALSGVCCFLLVMSSMMTSFPGGVAMMSPGLRLLLLWSENCICRMTMSPFL